MRQNLADLLAFYREQGLCTIPIPFKTKKATLEWKKYQTRLPNDQELQQWFGTDNTNIALVTGHISGNLVVLDFDDEVSFWDFIEKSKEKLKQDIHKLTPVVATAKGYHVYIRTKDLVKSQKFPRLDIKSEGGYVVAPPSLHPTGAQYLFVNGPPTSIMTVDSLVDIGIDLAQKIGTSNIPEGQPNWVTEALQKGVTEGQRNDVCFKLAGYFARHIPQDIALQIILQWNSKNRPPLQEGEVLETVKSAYKNTLTVDNNTNVVYSRLSRTSVPNRDKSVTDFVTPEQNIILARRIEDWLKDSTGWCSYDEIDKDLNLNPAERTNRRQIIKRLKDDGIVEAHPKRNKEIRYVNTNVRKIDFKSATKRTPLTIKFPFEIERFFNLYSGNIVVNAGAPDAGKTAWNLNFILLNQDKYPIFYQCSEMGKEELASRLMNFEGIELADWTFEAETRSSNFVDVIRPDCVNIIDYMEVSSDFYEVADTLKAIHDKLESGIAIVTIQKKIGASLGRGAEFSLEKPRLYLSMDKGKTTIIKAKNWVKPDFNPNGLVIRYKIVGGCKFIITQEWQKE